MSFLRHGEIYPCDEGTTSRPCPRSSPWMSLQLVIPGGLLFSRARFRFTSRSYTANYQPRPTMLRQRTAKCRLTDCLSRGVQSTSCLPIRHSGKEPQTQIKGQLASRTLEVGEMLPMGPFNYSQVPCRVMNTGREYPEAAAQAAETAR